MLLSIGGRWVSTYFCQNGRQGRVLCALSDTSDLYTKHRFAEKKVLGCADMYHGMLNCVTFKLPSLRTYFFYYVDDTHCCVLFAV
jgi:hypothetical protein